MKKLRTVVSLSTALVLSVLPVTSGHTLEPPAIPDPVDLLDTIGVDASVGLDASVEVDGLVGIDASVALQTSAHTDDNAENEARQWGREERTSADLRHIAQVIRSHQVRNRLTGAGIGVALVDTGVAPVEGLTDVVHGPDLSFDAPYEPLRHLDSYGHGTHLAGLITSDRSDAPGIAPDATLISLKAGAQNGAVDVSQVIAAIDWAVTHRAEHNIRVLVLAYGTDSTQDVTSDPLTHAVEQAWRHGIVVVSSAGNHGATSAPLSSPGRDPFVLTVGAADTKATNRPTDDELAAFSAPGTDDRRPDVVAPGVGVVSSAVPGSYLSTMYPEARREDELFRGHGTSQAAAITGGAVALLLQANPSLTPDQVKGILRDTATPIGGRTDRDDGAHGEGMINVENAVRRSGFAVPPYTQNHTPSSGTGTLEGARGSHHVQNADGKAVLTGEMDIHGQPFDAPSWAALSAAGTAWTDGVWNGVAWTGVGYGTTPWGGTAWEGGRWDGATWDGGRWDGATWDGATWDGGRWDGGRWDGGRWDGGRWDGGRWDSTRWE